MMTTYVYNRLIEAGISCVSPKGGFYLFPDWNNKKEILNSMDITTSKQLASFLLQTYNLASLPGSEFGIPENNLSLRLSTVDYDGTLVLNEYKKRDTTIEENSLEFIKEFAPNLVGACDILKKFTSSLK